jgi:hypothetical protein
MLYVSLFQEIIALSALFVKHGCVKLPLLKFSGKDSYFASFIKKARDLAYHYFNGLKPRDLYKNLEIIYKIIIVYGKANAIISTSKIF